MVLAKLQFPEPATWLTVHPGIFPSKSSAYGAFTAGGSVTWLVSKLSSEWNVSPARLCMNAESTLVPSTGKLQVKFKVAVSPGSNNAAFVCVNGPWGFAPLTYKATVAAPAAIFIEPLFFNFTVTTLPALQPAVGVIISTMAPLAAVF